MLFSGKNLIRKFNQKKITKKLQKNLKLFFLKDHYIKFPQFNEPEISIILVLFNQVQYTLACLRLLQSQKNISFEIIIIDNASSDSTSQLLDCCQNVVRVKNSENIGFLLAANQGAKMAKGKNLLFLNNDIWCLNEDALCIAFNTLNGDAKIGAVGAKVILPHGYLQEAGVIITPWGIKHYGRDKAPDIFEVMFQRQVDYCSGLFLLTPKHVFEQLDGFDTRYVPAYYEDSDYCLRLNYMGLKVIYEPRIIIGHIEGGSEVKKIDTQVLGKKNKALFNDKHKKWLQTLTHLSDFSVFFRKDVLVSRHHRRDCKRLLFIGNCMPSQHGLNLMKSACDADYVVSYYPLEKLKLSWDKIYNLFDIRIEVCHSSKLGGLDRFMENRSDYYDLIVDEMGNKERWSKYSRFLRAYPEGKS